MVIILNKIPTSTSPLPPASAGGGVYQAPIKRFQQLPFTSSAYCIYCSAPWGFKVFFVPRRRGVRTKRPKNIPN